MADTIGRIGGISYNATRIEPVRRRTKSEQSEILKEVAQAEADRAEFRALLAKHPNPNNLSFSELLEQGLDGSGSAGLSSAPEADDTGYILDISHK